MTTDNDYESHWITKIEDIIGKIRSIQIKDPDHGITFFSENALVKDSLIKYEGKKNKIEFRFS